MAEPAPIQILLADDNDDIRLLLRTAFRGTRFEIVTIAEDGDAAIAAWHEHRDRIDAVALDHRMPGADGLAVARRIRADAADTPIVLLTAEASAEVTAAADALAVAILTKEDILSLPGHPAYADLPAGS